MTYRAFFPVLLLVLVGPVLAAAASPDTVSAQGTIVYLDGTATVDARPAGVGDVIPLGATIRTAAASELEVVFRDRNILRLGELTTLVFNPGNLQVGSSLQQGSLALVLKNLVNGASADHNFYIRTPSTAAGVRGTLFFIKVEDPSTTYVCVCNGVVQLADGSQVGTLNVRSAHHTAYRFSGTGGTPTVSPAPLLYHSDADMEALAAKVGVTVDWTEAQ